MKRVLNSDFLPMMLLVVFFSAIRFGALAETAVQANFTPGLIPVTVPTFNCISIYWRPTNGSPSNTCSVEYKEKNSTKWEKAQDLWFDNSTYPDHNLLKSYRGSIVNLTAGVCYEIRLTLKSGAREIIQETTWNENFKISKTLNVKQNSSTFSTFEGGSKAEGYVVYDGEGKELNVDKNADYCINVDKSYVIIRNFKLRGASKSGITLSGTVSHVIIENCDISEWGSSRSGNFGRSQGAISLGKGEQVIVQRNKIHHPSFDTNNWSESVDGNFHPYGPCGLKGGGGWNVVVRFNDIYSGSPDIAYEDVIQFGLPDSDIHNNKLSDINDNGLELENGLCRNSRVWENYIYNCYNAISSIPVHLGPLYVWRNVMDKFHSDGKPDGSRPFKVGGNKYSGNAYEKQATKGAAYFYHNVNLQADADDGFQSADGGPLFLVSRNNILLAKHKSIQGCEDVTNSFDYDLYNSPVDVVEVHGIIGMPIWAYGNGPDSGTAKGYYQLAPSSPGYGQAVKLPNFNDMYRSPDVGAHQSGTPAMKFGVNAYSKKLKGK